MANTDQPPADPAASFLAEEYKLLRGEIEARSQEQRAMERNVVLIATGVYSFLLAKDAPTPSELSTAAWFIPPIVAILALGRWLESLSMIKSLARYMLNYELSIVGDKGGWEKSLFDTRKTEHRGYVSLTNIYFWTVMSGAPMALAINHTKPPGFSTHPLTLTLVGGVCAAALAFILIRRSGLNGPVENDP